jgi:hypothetical protein
VLIALALPLGATAQKSPLGVEFQVNTYTQSAQSYASVAADADGDFVVAWSSSGQELSGFGVFAQLFSSVGTPLASEFQVNSSTAEIQRSPSVAADADGDFVIAWWSPDGSSYGVFARRFSSAGTPLSGEFQVNVHTTGNQRIVTVATDDEGDFVIAWSSYDNQDGSDYGVFARRFTSAGAVLTDEFQVNTYTSGRQRHPSMAADADGDFVVAWSSHLQDGSSYGVFARRFSSAGSPLATEFQVNTYTTNQQYYPSLAIDTDGDFVVAWQSRDQDGYQLGVFARRFASGGAPLGGEFQVSTYTASVERLTTGASAVGLDADGDFIITWQSTGLYGSVHNVSARRFASAGAPLTTVFQVNTYTANDQRNPSVATEDDGDFVVAWHSFAQDGDNYGVFGQRFAALPVLDIDGNGSSESLTDGLLVLRFFFGFTGATLTNGAIGGGCTRCDAAAIQPYITGLGLVLDIDDNKMTSPLTDGLLALRFLFGFSGNTLVNGAVGGGCMRCDAPEIEAYLDGLSG